MSWFGVKFADIRTIAALAMLMPAVLCAVSWDIQSIDEDTGDITDASVDIFIDVNGTVHAVYFDKDELLSLEYAVNDGNGWGGL